MLPNWRFASTTRLKLWLSLPPTMARMTLSSITSPP